MTDKLDSSFKKIISKDTGSIKHNSKKKEENDIIIIKKIKTARNSNISKPKKIISKKIKKGKIPIKKIVKFNDNIDIINIESWKNHITQQTKEENFDEIISAEKEFNSKNNIVHKSEDKKIKMKLKEENVSCACIII